MKFSINTLIILTIILLIGINVAIFIKGISLSNEIHYYETELSSLKDQNIDFEQEIYKLESHVWTASLAAELEYGRYNDPLYVQSPKYALNQ